MFKDFFNFRDEFESDIEVEVTEIAGEPSPEPEASKG